MYNGFNKTERRRSMTLSELIIAYRKEKDISQRKFAEMCDLSNGYISMLEKGENPKTKQPITPTLPMLRKLAKGLNLSINELFSMVDDIDVILSEGDFSAKFPPPTATEDYVTFPVIGEIAAGYDNIAMENWEGDMVDIPNSYLGGRPREEFFVLKVKGGSMWPDYRDGDKVLILKQSTMDYSGQVGAVIYDDNIGTLKKIEYKNGENWMKLVPINPVVEVIEITGESLEHCRILGIPKLLIRNIEN